MSLDQIRELMEEHRAGRLTRRQSCERMREQKQYLQARAEKLKNVLAFLDAKVTGLDAGGTEPSLEHYLKSQP